MCFSRLRTLIIGAGVVTSMLVLSACGDEAAINSDRRTTSSVRTVPSDSSSMAPPSSSSTAPGTDESGVVIIYLLRGEKVGVAHRAVSGDRSGETRAALEELVGRPTDRESTAGLTTQVPQGTEILDFKIDESGLATVDLSSSFESGGGSLSMSARLAQVVFTATQEPVVTGVELLIDGERLEALGGEGLLVEHPTSRTDFASFMPEILVTSPAVGDDATNPVLITGENRTFEGTVNFGIETSDGALLREGFTTGVGGTGLWGPFTGELSYIAPADAALVLVVYEISAEDGTHVNVIEIPLAAPER